MHVDEIQTKEVSNTLQPDGGITGELVTSVEEIMKKRQGMMIRNVFY